VKEAIFRFFVRANAGQILLILFVFPTVAEMLLMFEQPSLKNPSPRFLAELFAFAVLWIACLTAWLWAIGTLAQSVTKPRHRVLYRIVPLAVVSPPLYSAVFVAVVANLLDIPPGVFLPLHLFAMFCMFYLLRFAAENLAQAERRRPVTFYDYAGPCFLIAAIPIGVWFIQPRVNKLYARSLKSEP